MSKGIGIEKKIGDWVWLYSGFSYKIKSVPEVFKNDRYATPKEITTQKAIEEL